MEPGLAGGAAVPAVLPGGPGQLRAHGAGRAAEDQGGAGLDAGVPAVVPGGHLRVVLHEHRRREHGGVPQARGRGHVAAEHGHAAAAHVRGQGPRRGPHQLLPAVQVRGAVAQDQEEGVVGVRGRSNDDAPRAPAVAGAAEEAGRAVRVHPVRVLQHGVPVLLVELGGVPGPRRAAARLPLGLRQPGRLRPGADTVAVGRVGQDVQVQDDQELHGDVPQEPRPRRRHLRHEGIAPAPQGLTSQGKPQWQAAMTCTIQRVENFRLENFVDANPQNLSMPLTERKTTTKNHLNIRHVNISEIFQSTEQLYRAF